jgi:lysozyme family protein
MTAAARIAIERTIALEGGKVDDPLDPGGATNRGISARFLRSIGDPRHPFDLSLDDTVELYRVHFWDAGSYDQFQHPMIAAKVFDMAVHMGSKQAHKLLQRALRAYGHPVIEDGVIGPKTIEAVNNSLPFPLLATLKLQASRHYLAAIAQRPASAKFAKGWLSRADA